MTFFVSPDNVSSKLKCSSGGWLSLAFSLSPLFCLAQSLLRVVPKNGGVTSNKSPYKNVPSSEWLTQPLPGGWQPQLGLI